MDFIAAFLRQTMPLSEEAETIFRSIFIEKSFKKGEAFVKVGEIPTKFFLLKKGVARSFTIDEKGRESIRTLFVPITTSGSLTSLIQRTPSESTYDCLTDCEFLEGDYSKFLEMANKHHEFALFHARVLEGIFIKVVHRISELSTLNATERYIKLKNEIPEVENLIPQYHIAAYLNISAVQLSRIRKELYSK